MGGLGFLRPDGAWEADPDGSDPLSPHLVRKSPFPDPFPPKNLPALHSTPLLTPIHHKLIQ